MPSFFENDILLQYAWLYSDHMLHLFGGGLFFVELTPFLINTSLASVDTHLQALVSDVVPTPQLPDPIYPPLYHYSIPIIRFFYPEPFSASPSFLHSDLWFTHILNYQYWLWFVFCTLIVFFLLTFVATLRWCQLRIRPRRETRGVSRSKCGDLITACVPVSWATSIIVHESTDAIDFFDGFGTTEMVMGIRAYQWGWEYFYPQNLNLNYQTSPSYSWFVGNSISYNVVSNHTRGGNPFFKFYKFSMETSSLNPLSFLLGEGTRDHLISSLNLLNFGGSRLKEMTAFQATRQKSNLCNPNQTQVASDQWRGLNTLNAYGSFSHLHMPLHLLLGDNDIRNRGLTLTAFQGNQWRDRVGLSTPLAEPTPESPVFVSCNGQHPTTSVYEGVTRETILAFTERDAPTLIREGTIQNFLPHIPHLEKPLNDRSWSWFTQDHIQIPWTASDLTQNYPTKTIQRLMTQDERITPSRIWNTTWETTGANTSTAIRADLWNQESHIREFTGPAPLSLYTRYDFIAKNDSILWDDLFLSLDGDVERDWEYYVDQGFSALMLRHRFRHETGWDEVEKDTADEKGLKFLRRWGRCGVQLHTPLHRISLVGQNSFMLGGYTSRTTALPQYPMLDLLGTLDLNSERFCHMREHLFQLGFYYQNTPTVAAITSVNYLFHFMPNVELIERGDTTFRDTEFWRGEGGGDEGGEDTPLIKRAGISLTKNRGAILKVFNNFYDEQRGHITLSQLSMNPHTPSYFMTPRTSFYTLVRKNSSAWVSIIPPRQHLGHQDVSTLDRMRFPFLTFPFLLGARSDSGKHRFFDWFARWSNFEVALAPEASFAASGVRHFHRGYQYDRGSNEAMREIDRYIVRLGKARKNYPLNWISVSGFWDVPLQNGEWFPSLQSLSNVNGVSYIEAISKSDQYLARSHVSKVGHRFIRDLENHTLRGVCEREYGDSLAQRAYLYQTLGRQRSLTGGEGCRDLVPRMLTGVPTPLTTLHVLHKYSQTAMRRGITSMNKIHATGAIALPSEIRLQILASSRDVIHSWAVPSAGIKIDCVPGYSSHRTFIFFLGGVYWGQCMEVCGRFHHWMPIIVYFLRRDLFILWCSHFALQHKMGWDAHPLTYPQKTLFRPLSYGARSWVGEL